MVMESQLLHTFSHERVMHKDYYSNKIYSKPKNLTYTDTYRYMYIYKFNRDNIQI